MSMNNTISAGINPLPANTTSFESHRLAPKPVEALLFLLPGVARSEAIAFKKWANEEGLVHFVRGNGVRPLQKKEFENPVPGGLRRNAQIFINGHGNTDTPQHQLLIDAKNKVHEQSIALMEATRRIPRAGIAADSELADSITLHMVTCHSGYLESEITPDKVLWARGSFFLYSGEETTKSEDAMPLVAQSLRYVGQCKKRQVPVDALALFESLAKCRSDYIAVGGGSLRSMVSARRPRGLSDIMRPLFATEPNHAPDKGIRGDIRSLKKLARIESTHCNDLQENERVDEPQISRILGRAIEHDDLSALIEIIEKYPNLIQIKNGNGNPILIWAVALNSMTILNWLIDKLDDLDMPGQDGATALHCALHGTQSDNQIRIINLLLRGNSRGVRASLEVRDDLGNTALLAALELRAFTAASLFCAAGANVDVTNHAGIRPLMLAAENGKRDLTQAILAKDPHPYATDLVGETAADKVDRRQRALQKQAAIKSPAAHTG